MAAGRTRLGIAVAVTLAAALLWLPGPQAVQAQAGPAPAGELGLLDYGIQGEGHARVHSVDRRIGAEAPTADQLAHVAELRATRATWNAFGTPHVLLRHGGALSAPVAGEAVDVARAFVAQHADLFRLSAEAVAALEVLRDSPLYDAPDLLRARDGEPVANPDVAHVVLFRQTFGDLGAGRDGLLTVGVDADGRVVWVSSTVTGDDVVSGEATLSAADAIRAVAADVGHAVGGLTPVDTADDWATFASDVVGEVQRARPVAIPTFTQGLRRAFEVTLLDAAPDADGHGNPVAFIAFVDAEDGTVWQRSNEVHHLHGGGAVAQVGAPSGGQFSGSTVPGDCGPDHPFAVGAGNGTITVGAAATTPPEATDDDITIRLSFQGEVVATQDLLGSPEVLTYAPPGGIPEGEYLVAVCPFNGAAAPAIPYQGAFTTSAGSAGAGVPLPAWRVFPTNPRLTTAENPSEDTRVLWCWGADVSPDCETDVSNGASRSPWDVIPGALPTLTTAGNNASTAISEASFLTPDTAFDRPAPDPTRDYQAAWANRWFESGCDPSNFATDNDDDASTYNLFVMHNRMHDWSYFLGFTEVNANLQQTNFGNGQEEGDPELGSSQAGRLTFNGRDNANQITLQDGIPGVTNQYLWQPLAGAFYGTCTDGAYDMAIVAHEYAHAISTRMTAGPDTGLGATQGQSESWSDLAFAEYFRGFGLTAGEGVNPFALAPLVTGDPQAGIRNYGMNASPLNYSDIQYDGVGTTSPHSDGEIWSAVNYDIALDLNATWDAEFPSDDLDLQRSCAQGERPADICPGNRRWVQLMFDGFLLQPADNSMVDSRDAMLAADMLRFGGANQDDLWAAFAERGLGEGAVSDGPGDPDPTPSFVSPLSDDTATVTFVAGGDGDDETAMEVFVGVHEARATPVANTFDETVVDDDGEEEPQTGGGEEPPARPAISASAGFEPGRYDLIATAPGLGGYRFSLDLAAGEERTVVLPLRHNLASSSLGAAATGDGVNLELLIDDTEETNWASLDADADPEAAEGEQVAGRTVTVDLAGDDAVAVAEVGVSAALRPEILSEEDPIIGGEPEEPDPGGQQRFSALRSFDILACDATSGADCASDAGYTQVFASADDAFDGHRPRPRAPDFTLRTFDVDDTQATHLRLVVRDNQCTGGPDFQGEANPVNDPIFQLPDCDSPDTSPDRAVLSPPNLQVRAAELQVFSEPAPTLGAIDRVFGGDRVATAVALSQEAFATADAVVLARADDFPDALAAATLAAEVDGPLLLTATTSLDPRVAAEIERLGATTAYLTGGTAALSTAVETAAADLVADVVRLAGPDRYTTAVRIAEQVETLGGTVDGVLLARADDFPDALAAANLATSRRLPILLTDTAALTPVTADGLSRLLGGSGTVTVLGGDAAVSAAAADTVAGSGYAVVRIFGADRYGTAVAVLTEFLTASGSDLSPLLLASGTNFPDALTAGPAAHALGGALALVAPDALANSPALEAFLLARSGEIDQILVAGGPAAVSDAVLQAVSTVLGRS